MNDKIKKLKEEIINCCNIESTELFAGANLIITSDKNKRGKTQDVIVFSDNAKDLSCFVFKLKSFFEEELDYINKYSFYPHIGKLLNEAIGKELNVKEQMLFVIENMVGFRK